MDKLLKFILGSLFFFCLTLPTQAAILNSSNGPQPIGVAASFAHTAGYNLDASANLENTIATVIRLVLSILGTIFLILIFMAGYNWMTAAGNEETIKKSKETIRDLVIGLCLILAAYAFSSYLAGLLSAVLL